MMSKLFSTIICRAVSISTSKKVSLHRGGCFLHWTKTNTLHEETSTRCLHVRTLMLFCFHFMAPAGCFLRSKLSSPKQMNLCPCQVLKQILTPCLFFSFLIVMPERLSLIYMRLNAMRLHD